MYYYWVFAILVVCSVFIFQFSDLGMQICLLPPNPAFPAITPFSPFLSILSLRKNSWQQSLPETLTKLLLDVQ